MPKQAGSGTDHGASSSGSSASSSRAKSGGARLCIPASELAAAQQRLADKRISLGNQGMFELLSDCMRVASGQQTTLTDRHVMALFRQMYPKGATKEDHHLKAVGMLVDNDIFHADAIWAAADDVTRGRLQGVCPRYNALPLRNMLSGFEELQQVVLHGAPVPAGGLLQAVWQQHLHAAGRPIATPMREIGKLIAAVTLLQSFEGGTAVLNCEALLSVKELPTLQQCAAVRDALTPACAAYGIPLQPAPPEMAGRSTSSMQQQQQQPQQQASSGRSSQGSSSSSGLQGPGASSSIASQLSGLSIQPPAAAPGATAAASTGCRVFGAMHKEGSAGGKLMLCSRCRNPADKYCSVEHQKADWRRHKQQCRPAAA